MEIVFRSGFPDSSIFGISPFRNTRIMFQYLITVFNKLVDALLCVIQITRNIRQKIL